MNMIAKFFAPKTAITSDSVRAEIARSESEIADHRAKLVGSLAGIATMTDAEHIAAETNIASIKRAISRLEARIAHFKDELPEIIAAEEAAAKAAADEALRQRAEAARKANSVTAKKLLSEYADAAMKVADIIDKLDTITKETAAVNEALQANPVAERVSGYDMLHRSTPYQPATENRETKPHWVYRDAPLREWEVGGVQESATLATLDKDGKPVPPGTLHRGHDGRIITPRLEMREVVTRTSPRHGRYEDGLSGARLPPAFVGQPWYWPRA